MPETLNGLRKGEMAVVTKLNSEDGMGKRLRDIGMITGTKIECLGESPLGDPAAYLIRGAVIALRTDDANKIHIKRIPTEKKERGNKVIGLAGNPNVGKSTVFNQLTGLNQHTGNWPGKTVANAKGYCEHCGNGYVLVDVPGCYSLMARSEEEVVARDFICQSKPDAVVVVCDATCLERNLNLVLQIMEVSQSVVVCINLMDEAKKKGISIDFAKLEQLLGVPVVGTAARSKEGLDILLETLDNLFENLPSKEDKMKSQEFLDESTWEERTTRYVIRGEKIAAQAVSFANSDYGRGDRRLDRLFTSKQTGFPIMLLMLLFVFWLTITGSNYPSQLLSKGLFWIEDYLAGGFEYMKVPSVLTDLFVHGMYRTVAWVVAVMLPPMAIFFPLFSLLEDFGYLPRVAFNLDKYFHKCSACGKQALTMCMGLGCNAAGVVGCRIIDSPRERLIAMITNSFVPCNGRFPTIIAIISMFFIGGKLGFFSTVVSAVFLLAVIVLGIIMTFLISKILSKTILKGMPSSFTMELPPYRCPQFGKVIWRSIFDRTLFVLGRAAAVAAPAGLIIWGMANTTIGNQSILSICSGFFDPFGRLLGMDGTIILAFILGFPANEIVVPIMLMAYLSQGSLQDIGSLTQMKQILTDHGWTAITAVSTILFSLMHWPCSTTCLTIHKESGSAKWTIAAFLIPSMTGTIVCFLFTAAAKGILNYL